MSRIKYVGLFVLLVLLVLSFGAAGCAKKPAENPAVKKTEAPIDIKETNKGNVIASVGSDSITTEEYKEEMALLPPVYRAMANSNKQQFIDSLINKHLLLEEARKLRLEDRESVKKLLEKAKEEIMMQELIGTEITDKIKVGGDEIEKYYQQNTEKFMESAKTRASHILVDSEVVAQKVLADLKGGADFAKEAGEYSLDTPTKDKGGDTGYFAKGSLLPEFEEACDKLKAGETSDIVKTPLGYHIIKITERKEAGPRPLDTVKTEIENELFVEKQINLYNDLIKKLKEGKEIKIDNTALEKVTAE